MYDLRASSFSSERLYFTFFMPLGSSCCQVFFYAQIKNFSVLY